MKTLDASAGGVYLITVTPFTDQGALDLASTDSMVDFCLASGVTGLTVLGIMGEATKLTAAESAQFVERVVTRVAGRVPVVVGASAPGFAPMRELSVGLAFRQGVTLRAQGAQVVICLAHLGLDLSRRPIDLYQMIHSW